MNVLMIISFVIFALFIGAVVKLFGVPASISDTYYLFETKRKGLGWLFTAFCLGVAGFLLPGWLDMTPGGYQFTCFLAAAGLLFVGVAAQFKEGLTHTVHYTSAIVCGVFSQVWCILSGFWWVSLLSFALFLGIAWKSKAKNWMFWAEIAAIAATYISVLLY